MTALLKLGRVSAQTKSNEPNIFEDDGSKDFYRVNGGACVLVTLGTNADPTNDYEPC